jgi:hypothetical protein
MRILKPASDTQAAALGRALQYLKLARSCLAYAECPAALDKVRSAIKSVEGAERHMGRRLAG